MCFLSQSFDEQKCFKEKYFQMVTKFLTKIQVLARTKHLTFSPLEKNKKKECSTLSEAHLVI